MALEKGFTHIEFARLKDLVKFKIPLPEKMEEITYVANATNFRRYLFNQFGKDDLDIDHEIATNTDMQMTYLGYRRFLESDLRYIFGHGRSNRSYKKGVRYLAKQMLIRGYVCLFPIVASEPMEMAIFFRLKLITHEIGFRGRSQSCFSGTPTPLDPSIDRRAQGIHELAQHQGGIHDPLALHRCADAEWRLDKWYNE